MALWGNSGRQASLTPPGVGAGLNADQFNMFANAANSSGLTEMAVGKLDGMTNGMKNEDQVQLLHQLMVSQPNPLALFFLEYPGFMKELSALMALIIKKELYAWFSAGVVSAPINAEKAAEYGYSTITDENIESQITKMIPAQEMAMKIQQSDMQAVQLMNGHQQNMMMGNMAMQQQQQQQMYNQQMYNQQMMQQQQQRPGVAGALGNFGSTLIRGSLGLPPAQQQAMQQPGMLPQQPGMYQQPM